MDSIYELVSVWEKSKNGFGNNYESQGFVRGLKKTCGCCFWQFRERTKKRDQCPCGRNFDVFRRGLERGVAYVY